MPVGFGLHLQGSRGVPSEIASPAFQRGRNDGLSAAVSVWLHRIGFLACEKITQVYEVITINLSGTERGVIDSNYLRLS